MTQTPAAGVTEAVSPVVSGLVQLIAPRKLPRIEAEQRLVGDLGFHSLVLAELGYNLEELYDLRPLNPEEAMKLERVSDVIALVCAEVTEGRAQLPEEDAVTSVFARYGYEGPAA
ncbi:acyl carrier protein [Streptomyces sp. NPDC018000]|uniref:acyl carrier protein n=1 Tax=Streptomyces sp. NPDC018000 TaxID=3365028 RepID=UPI003789282D